MFQPVAYNNDESSQPADQIGAPAEFVEDDSFRSSKLNKSPRSAFVCGTCKCNLISGVADVTHCEWENDYVKIFGITFSNVTIAKLIHDRRYPENNYYFKGNSIVAIKDFVEIPGQSKIIFEKNEKLTLEHLSTPRRFHTVEFREKALHSFYDDAFTVARLVFTELRNSNMSLFPHSQNWKSIQPEEITIRGKMTDISSFADVSKLQTAFLDGVSSSLGKQLLPHNFVFLNDKLSLVNVVNTNDAVLPQFFASGSTSPAMSITIDLWNIGKESLDKNIVINLNGKKLSDPQRNALIKSSDINLCKIFCSNKDCVNDQDKMNSKNCAICVRNNRGKNETLEKDICDYGAATTASTTVIPPSTTSMDYYIDYWPNEGSDYLDL